MTPTSEEGQRAELHKTIWRIVNDLRGSVDGWDFETYVLRILFYHFISENLTPTSTRASMRLARPASATHAYLTLSPNWNTRRR